MFGEKKKKKMEGKAELSETHVNRARRIVGISHTHTTHHDRTHSVSGYAS